MSTTDLAAASGNLLRSPPCEAPSSHVQPIHLCDRRKQTLLPPSANDLTFATLPSIEALDVVFSYGNVFQFNQFSKGQFIGTV